MIFCFPLATVATVSKKEIGRCFQLILKSHHDINVEINQPGDFTNRFCGNLGLDHDIQRAVTVIGMK